MTPYESYLRDLKHPDFSRDASQEAAVKHLDRLYHELVAREANRPQGLRKWFDRKARRVAKEPAKGLYFWGGVGRGKTYLVDTFHDSLPFKEKMRVHFHRFMQRVHKELKALQGEQDPLVIVADRIAAEARVLCFDEFFVSDITDAMILGGLLEQLFARGVTLVATSNIVPERLYENGLQRDRFLPAIELLKTYTEVVNVDGGVDYRLRTLEQADIFYTPLGEKADASLQKSFNALAPEPGYKDTQIEIEGRPIDCRKVTGGVLWCDFKALCDGPRSQNDYIELAKIYHAVLVSNVPVMSGAQDDMARRFINMVDEFYDRNVKLIMSAEAPIEQLYTGTNLAFVFERTCSRLLEMQSHEYLSRAHRP